MAVLPPPSKQKAPPIPKRFTPAFRQAEAQRRIDEQKSVQQETVTIQESIQEKNIFEQQKEIFDYYNKIYGPKQAERYKDLYFAQRELENLQKSGANFQLVFEQQKRIAGIQQDIARTAGAGEQTKGVGIDTVITKSSGEKIILQSSKSGQIVIDPSVLTGGYSGASGYTGIGYTSTPTKPSVDFSPASNQNFLASSTKGPDYVITTQGELKREPFTPIQGGAVFTRQEQLSLPQKNFSENTGYTPFGQWLIKERGVSRTIEDLEQRFLKGVDIQLSREPSKREGILLVKGAGQRGLFPILKIVAEPQEKIPMIAGGIYAFGQGAYSFKKINGVQQLVPNDEFLIGARKSFVKDITTNPSEFIGGLAGGAIVDAGFTLPLIGFVSRPLVNVSSRAKNFVRGVDVGVVEGTTNYNIIVKDGKSYLLVPDIHSKIGSISEVGDVSLKNLVQQTNAGTGRTTGGLTFVGGALSKAKPGDDFLLRQIKNHWKGVKESPLYASPEAVLSKELVVSTNTGSKIVLPKGTVLQVGSKQFSNLSESGYSGVEFGFKNEKALGFLTNEKVSRVPFAENVLEYRRRFFSPEQSGKGTIQFSNEIGASIERQTGFQAQGVRFFRSRGSRFKATELSLEKPIGADIYNRKLLPFGMGEKYKYVQELYEDVGFGREYKYVEFLKGDIRVPVGRPPTKDFEGEPVYVRPTARAIVEEPFTGKLLFVKEGEQSFIFPGGGVDPILVPGQGKEGVRLDYPKVKDFGKTASRELSEETGGIALRTKPIKGIVIESEVKNFNPPVTAGGKTFPVFQFKDVNRFYKVDSLPTYSPKGEIDTIAKFTPEEALARSDVGSVEKEFIRQYYLKQKPSTVPIESSLTKKEISKIEKELSPEEYVPPRRITLYENLPRTRVLMQQKSLVEKPNYSLSESRRKIVYPSSYPREPSKEKIPIRTYEPSERMREPFGREIFRFETRGPIIERQREPPRESFPYRGSEYREPILTIEPIIRVREPGKPYPRPFPTRRPRDSSRRKETSQYRQRDSFEPGFVAYYVTGGKRGEKVSEQRYTFRDVFNIGAIGVQSSIKRTFEIVPEGVATPRNIQGPTNILRPGKKPGTFVEQTKYAISTPLEKRTLKLAKQNTIRGNNPKAFRSVKYA